MKEAKSSLYGYDVSNAGCYVGIAVFGILSLHHTWLLFRNKCWYWTPFWIGGWMEVAGYAIRRVSGDENKNISLFAVQFLFVLLPPIFFAASIYMTLGRLLRFIGATQLSPIRIKWVTPIFVSGDIVSLLMVGAGGGIQATADSDKDARDTGNAIMMTGLAVQLLFFTIFIVETAICHFRLHRRQWGSSSSSGRLNWPWLFLSLYVGCILIFIRSVFRVIEYAQGWDGYLVSHEIYMYMFDTLLMALCMLSYSIVHPAYVITKTPANIVSKESTDLEAIALRGPDSRF